MDLTPSSLSLQLDLEHHKIFEYFEKSLRHCGSNLSSKFPSGILSSKWCDYYW